MARIEVALPVSLRRRRGRGAAGVALALALLAGATTGAEPEALRGRYTRARTAADALDPESAALAQRLEALGYAEGVRPAHGATGVLRFDRARALAGRNLVTSGHAAEVELVDMEGRVLHRWARPIEDVFPDDAARSPEHATHWRRARALPNGDLVAIYEGIGVVALDRDSRVRWSRRNGAHHDLRVAPDGSVLLLTREVRVAPAIDAKRPVLEEFVERLDANGESRERISLFDALARSPYSSVLAYRESGDILHANAIVELAAEPRVANPAFAPGRLLVSLRNASALAVLDPKSERIEWLHTGSHVGQHDPSVLASGRILLFDNGSTGVRHETGGRSRVLELDPVTGAESVVYEGTQDEPFFSATCGAVARLANGNLLVTETDAGRAFELAPGGDTVWEYVTPHRAGANGELVATLFEVERVASDFGDAWLASRPEPGVRPPPPSPAVRKRRIARFLVPGLGALAALVLAPALVRAARKRAARR